MMKPDDSKVRYWAVALLAVLYAGCAPMPAGTPISSTESAGAPTVNVGDSWTYRVSDRYTGLERGTERYRVEQVSGSQITVARDLSGTQDVQLYDRQWNWLKRPATNLKSFDYTPAYQAFDFPLAPGKTWNVRLTAIDPGDGRRFPVRVEGNVVGWERIRVPAGEFDALKVVRRVYLDYWEQTIRGSSQIMEVDWYAPAVKQSVRREARSRYWSWLGSAEPRFIPVRGKDDGGPRWMEDDWLVYELVSYSAR